MTPRVNTVTIVPFSRLAESGWTSTLVIVPWSSHGNEDRCLGREAIAVKSSPRGSPDHVLCVLAIVLIADDMARRAQVMNKL